jgi:hypothetical protein
LKYICKVDVGSNRRDRRTARTELSQDWEACEPTTSIDVAIGDQTPWEAPEADNVDATVDDGSVDRHLGNGQSDRAKHSEGEHKRKRG